MKLRYYLRGLGIGVIVAAVLMGIALGGDKEKLTDAEIMARAKQLGMVESAVLADLGKTNQTDESQAGEAVKEPESQVGDGQTGEDVKEPESQVGENQTGEDVKEPESQVGENQTGEDVKEPESQVGENQTGEDVKEPESQVGENQTGEDVKEQESQAGESQDGGSQTGEAVKEPETQTGDTQTGETEEYVTLVISKGESSVSVSKSLAELGLVESAKAFDRYLCDNGYDKYIKVGTHKIKVGATDEEIAETISRKKK